MRLMGAARATMHAIASHACSAPSASTPEGQCAHGLQMTADTDAHGGAHHTSIAEDFMLGGVTAAVSRVCLS